MSCWADSNAAFATFKPLTSANAAFFHTGRRAPAGMRLPPCFICPCPHFQMYLCSHCSWCSHPGPHVHRHLQNGHMASSYATCLFVASILLPPLRGWYCQMWWTSRKEQNSQGFLDRTSVLAYTFGAMGGCNGRSHPLTVWGLSLTGLRTPRREGKFLALFCKQRNWGLGRSIKLCKEKGLGLNLYRQGNL